MKEESSARTLSILSLVGFAAVITLNTLATTLPLGGMTTGQLSDLYPNLFVPAGITFSIWGIIYLLLAAFVVYSLISAWKGPVERSFVERIGLLFIATCVANCGWILAWQYRLVGLSLLFMLLLLAALLFIYFRLGIGRAKAPAAVRYLVHLPMSIYLGWIAIATLANVTALLAAHRWAGAASQGWAIAMIVVGVLLAIGAALWRRDPFYALVADWALLGIYLKRSADLAAPAQAVVVASVVGFAIVTVAIVVQVARRKIYA